MNTQILSSVTGQPVTVQFAMVGKGKSLHYSPSNDETLCGRPISAYVDGNDHVDAPLCKRCASVERVRSDEYAAWLESQETATVEPVSEGVEDESTPDVTDAHTATVTVQDMPGVDPSAVPSECYFGCGRPVTGAFADYVGRTEGVCDLDRGQLDASTLVVPVDPAVWGGAASDDSNRPTVPTVGVVQNTPGMNAVTHYHTPGCRDIAREMKRYGQRQSDVQEFAFADVAEILEFEYGDVASDNEESNTPEWWTEILANAQYDTNDVYGMGVRIMPCLEIPLGMAGDRPLKLINGVYRIDTVETASVSHKGTHALSFKVETEGRGDLFECANCGSIGTPKELAAFACELSTVTDERMTMVHRGAHFPSCDWQNEFSGAPVSMLAADLTCPKCIAELDPTVVTSPKVHAFPSTEEAYNASQCVAEIHDGDVLSVPSEGIVGILVKAWPVSLTSDAGHFHAPEGGIQDFLIAQRDSDGSDYGKSLTLALSTMRVMRETIHNANPNLCNVPNCAECANYYYAECRANHTGDNLCAACTAYEAAFAPQDDTDAGFVETIDTMEYHLSVVVDETTGATVDLGWVVLDMNRAQAYDHARIAEAYGAAHGTGKPRHGWESIIRVHAIEAL